MKSAAMARTGSQKANSSELTTIVAVRVARATMMPGFA